MLRQRASAYAQRGANRQPAGRLNCPGTTPGIAGTASILAGAAADARGTLSQDEIGTLLAGLGIALADGSPPAARACDVELSIGLHDTREFGMVLSAGPGGPDAALEEESLKSGQASVHACVELTDADDFLGLFRRTLAYQRAPYDIERAAQKIKSARLPAILSARLFVGR